MSSPAFFEQLGAAPTEEVRGLPMNRLLDPKLDVVFKLLFADEQNRELLSALLNAILEPAEPIADVVVLNPETPKETVVDKGAVLDVRVRLRDGRQIHVEMQSAAHPGLRQRALFYWARLYTGQLGRGRDYLELEATVSIFILNFVELSTRRYHGVFRLLERDEGALLTDDLAIHVLELPKLPRGPVGADGPSVVNWGRFFAPECEAELEQLAMIDPNLRRAKAALERLSADPAAQELARERELAAWNYQRGLHLARREGEAKGEAKAKADDVLAVLEARGVEITAETRARVTASQDIAELDRWLRRAATVGSARELFVG